MSDVTTLEELNRAVVTDGRVVVLFTQPSTCVPCRQFKPHWQRAQENVDDIKFLTVDLDTLPEAAVRYGVLRVPTVKLYEDGVFSRDVKAPQGAAPFINDIRE